MNATPSEPAPADLGTLLNQAVLQLSPDVRVAPLAKDRIALKYQPGRRYLVVTPRQWEMLQEFKAGRTGTAVLCDLITGQRTPSLREFYELVLHAVQAGILQTTGQPVPAEETPARWPLRVPGVVVRGLTVAAALAALISLGLRPVALPTAASGYGIGWLVVCVAASLGTVLAAAVVRAAGRDVYRLHWAWKTLFPRFAAELGDARLGGRALPADVALAQLAPHFLALVGTAWWAPDWQLPVLAGTLLHLAPVGRTPLLDLLGALYRHFVLSTEATPVFGRDRWTTWLQRVHREWRNPRYYAAWIVATLLWCGLAVAATARLWPERLRAHLGWRPALAEVQQLGLILGFALAVMAGLLVLGLLAWGLFRLAGWWRERTERQLRPAAVLVSPQTIAGWLGQSLLFRDLSAEDLAAVAAAVKPEEHRRGSYVVREGEPGERLYIVLSGRLEVRRDYAPGRSEPVAEMGEGDVFGEIALLQGGPRTRSIRSLGRSVLLALDKADFERLVLTRLSRQAIEDAVQKVGFLQHTELTRHWNQATLAAFARRAKLQELAEGAVVLKEAEPNHWFFLVHRGELSVQQKGRELRRLKQGDSFGELSLVGDGHASATIVVRSKAASCLVIAGRDFLEFITHDFAIGLKWDELKTRPKEKSRQQR